jgi:hypothetical protein
MIFCYQAQQDMKKSFDAEKIRFQDVLAENKQSFEALLAGLQVENKALFEQSRESESKLR